MQSLASVLPQPEQHTVAKVSPSVGTKCHMQMLSIYSADGSMAFDIRSTDWAISHEHLSGWKAGTPVPWPVRRDTCNSRLTNASVRAGLTSSLRAL